MRKTLKINSLFIHSETNNKSFFTTFGNKLNVIYGANTARKSTLIQLILYTLGINDNKIKLSEIISENIFSRLDFEIIDSESKTEYNFIRNNQTLYIKNSKNKKNQIFNGIDANNSVEHIKLKKFISELFDFNLFLESKDGLVSAPIEAIFLPYYVSQDVGWVYLRKSFSNLDFYKNFKEDFLDYYLGVQKAEDKSERIELEKELKDKEQLLKFYLNYKLNDNKIDEAKIIEDSFNGEAEYFINRINENKSNLLKLENQLIKLSNEIAFYTQRNAVVSKVSRNHKNQFPGNDNCPVCTQTLPLNTKTIYKFYQEENDTIKIKKDLADKLKNSQSQLNSTQKKLEELREVINRDNQTFRKYSNSSISIEEWIQNRSLINLGQKINEKIGEISIEIEKIKGELKKYKNDEDLYFVRNLKNKYFKKLYQINNALLEVPKLKDDRFNYIYELSSFPFQGVELHLAVLSYHFAFNKIISENSNIHRLPFILDSIFKEDLEPNSKHKILEFISKNIPMDTQTIVSIADFKNKDPQIENYKKSYFPQGTELICIGDSTNKNSILSKHSENLNDILSDTFEIMENIN